MPGMAASTSDTCSFGPAPKPTAAPLNSFEFEATWAWTSSPRTISQSPVRPLSLRASVILPPTLRLAPEGGGLFQRARRGEHGRFVQRLADDLQTQRQAAGVETGRHADRRQA